MKKMNLLTLSLTNFKGIKHLQLNAMGENIKVYGDNGTGKTTIFDAFVWLLFDKDSQNKKDFQIKTLQNGNVIHKLNHEVEGSFLVDGEQLTLKKVYTEKWTKKRGSISTDFSGHTTDYFVDGVPSKKNEYTAKVASIVDENIFKLLTNPSYFNTQLTKTERRDLLLEIAGDITEQDVIFSNQALAKLSAVLNGRSIEDHKKVIAAKRKEINKELERIPIRVDELYRGLPEVGGLDRLDLQAELDSLDKDIDAKDRQINSIRNGGEINKLRAEISGIDLHLSNLRNEHIQHSQQELFRIKASLQEEKANISLLENKSFSFEQKKIGNENLIKEYEERMQVLREQWIAQNSKEFDHETNCSCPSCGQELPEDQLEEVKANFNRNKSEFLETINKKGAELKGKVESLQAENDSITSDIDKLKEQVEEKNNVISSLKKKIKVAESSGKPISDNAQYKHCQSEKESVLQQIEELQASVDESVGKVEQEIYSLKEKRNSLYADLSALKEAERVKQRIIELEAEEEDLAAQFEQMEHELYLTEEFIRTKVNLLEEKINSKFKYAKFKLFDEQINGGLKEDCETLYDGVPYSSGLNNAAQINVGLDIINTLSDHYGVQAPIFVDNAESVTRLIDIDAQVVSLIVSEADKQLRVENKKEVEVA